MAMADLLPGWYDDWAVLEQQQFLDQRSMCLDSLARRLLQAGQVEAALEASRAALDLDPYRQSSARTAVRAHLEMGNPADAIRVYRIYRDRCLHDFGVAPTDHLVRLVANLDARATSPDMDQSMDAAVARTHVGIRAIKPASNAGRPVRTVIPLERPTPP